MTPSSLPPRDDVAENDTQELHALYREGSQAEPGPALDAAILAAARKEVQAGPVRRPAVWWRRWLPATSAIAVAVLGVSLTLRVMDEAERSQRVLPETSVVTRDSPAVAGEATGGLPALDAAKDAASASGPAIGVTRPHPEAQAENDAARAPMSTRPTLKKQRAEAQAAAPETRATNERHQADDAATPVAWVEHIRSLQSSGRHAEARQSLARLQARYPDFVLPDDLSALR